MGKVCDLCIGLETDISVVLTIMNVLGSSTEDYKFLLEIWMVQDTMVLFMV
jgi:hypothetical protein